MQDFKKTQSTAKRILRFSVRLALTLVLVGFAAVSVRAAWDMYGTFKVAANAREDTLRQLNSLKSDQARVEASVASFQTPTGMEAQIRDRFGVAKPGEGEIQIIADAEASTAPATSQEPWYARVFHALFTW